MSELETAEEKRNVSDQVWFNWAYIYIETCLAAFDQWGSFSFYLEGWKDSSRHEGLLRPTAGAPITFPSCSMEHASQLVLTQSRTTLIRCRFSYWGALLLLLWEASVLLFHCLLVSGAGWLGGIFDPPLYTSKWTGEWCIPSLSPSLLL